jgi:hypothetical protein
MNFFDNSTTISIFNTTLLPLVTHDVPTWKLKKDNVYTVKSAYKDILNHDAAILQHHVSGNWKCAWSLKLPPNVKNFVWRGCRNCFLTRN